MKKTEDKGFTLVELLIVIVILGILATVVVFSVTGIRDKGDASACNTEGRTLVTALEASYAETGAYPNDQATLEGNYFANSGLQYFSWDGSAIAAVGTLPTGCNLPTV